VNLHDGSSRDNDEVASNVAKIIHKKIKKNGLALPLNPLQVIAWFVMLLDFYAYYFINIVAFSYSIAISTVIAIIFTGLIIAILYYGVLATVTDPTDPTIYAERKSESLG
jgi:hypothetical protein